MIDNFGCNHTNIVLDTPELANALESAMVARDMPGMADVDSSLYLFCKEIKKDVSVVLSGECSDEIFAGYPWFLEKMLYIVILFHGLLQFAKDKNY